MILSDHQIIRVRKLALLSVELFRWPSPCYSPLAILHLISSPRHNARVKIFFLLEFALLLLYFTSTIHVAPTSRGFMQIISSASFSFPILHPRPPPRISMLLTASPPLATSSRRGFLFTSNGPDSRNIYVANDATRPLNKCIQCSPA